MKKILFIVLIALSFFLMPNPAFACGNNSEKNSRDKVACTDTENMDCCNMDCCKNDSHSKKNNHGGCNGKCGHSNCITTSPQYSAVFFEIKFNHYDFSSSERKQNYFYTNTSLSSGFHSLWLIPKIG